MEYGKEEREIISLSLSLSQLAYVISKIVSLSLSFAQNSQLFNYPGTKLIALIAACAAAYRAYRNTSNMR